MKHTPESFNRSMHRLGRIGIAIIVSMLFLVPFIFALYHQAFPSLSVFLQAAIGITFMFLPILISEVFMFTPIVGSGTYITFITGNVMNIKIPIAHNAQSIMNTTKGTESSDVITTLAISVSAMVTTTTMGIGVLLLVPLEPFMSSAPIQTASGYVLPALFGALVVGLLSTSGKVKVKGKVKAGVLPFFVLLLVNIFVINTYQYSGILLLVMIPFTILCARFLYHRKMISIEILES